MRVLAAIAVLGLLSAPPGATLAGSKPRPGTTPAKGAPKAPAAQRPAARTASPQLERARDNLATLKKSPVKRRYRHNWERAIRDLERAARGPDTGPALLDAARARYALYRFSAVEADREKALTLAARAGKAGATAAPALAAAIRREAGDEEPKARPEPAATARRPAPA
jgi:N-acetylmuramoyl-L-alanine amidase